MLQRKMQVHVSIVLTCIRDELLTSSVRLLIVRANCSRVQLILRNLSQTGLKIQ